jgi:hypothetical protein
LAALLLFSACNDVPFDPGPIDVLERLDALPGVDVSEIVPYYGYPRAFRIDITQPVNHADPEGPQFTQRAYLSHVDTTMPMVFAPGGYAVTERSGQEMAGILRTNCLNVTHRFFEGSQPDPLDWQYLTIEQSAADHHRIVEIFKDVYTGVWLSAGVSKSGLTSLYHRRFYPDDVSATVAYVAPFKFSTADSRFVDFLETLGDELCRSSIHRFQRAVLQHRDSLIPRFSAWFPANGYIHPADTIGEFESAARTYDWSFWQYTEHDCDGVPGPEASFDEMLTHLNEVVRLSRMTDERSVYMRPYLYQAFTQIGYPERRYDHIADLLVRELGGLSGGYFDSLGVELVYRPETVLDIYDWLLTEGDNIVYIYGGADPWTAGAIELIGQTNALKVVQAGANHAVKIADLDDPNGVLARLENWLGIPIPELAGLFAVIADMEVDLMVPGRY